MTAEARSSKVPLAAIIAGQLGGLAFLGIWSGGYFIRQDLPWQWPIQVIASFVQGEAALFSPTALTYVIGVLLNQLVALVWSGFFAWVALNPIYPHRLSGNVVAGILLGLLVAFIDIHFLVPPLFGLIQDMDYWWVYLDRVWDWVAHLAFGMTTGWFFHVFSPRGAVSRRQRFALSP